MQMERLADQILRVKSRCGLEGLAQEEIHWMNGGSNERTVPALARASRPAAQR